VHFRGRDQRDARSAQADADMELTLALAPPCRRHPGVECRPKRGQCWRGSAANHGALLPIANSRSSCLMASRHYALYPRHISKRPDRCRARSQGGRLRSIGTAPRGHGRSRGGSALPRDGQARRSSLRPLPRLANGETLGLGAHAHLAIVDEGPGLSGSFHRRRRRSCGARGAEGERIHVLSRAIGTGRPASERGEPALLGGAQVSFCSSTTSRCCRTSRWHRLESWVATLSAIRSSRSGNLRRGLGAG
jgi:hypothetical protein